jgi:hypothetical protein
MRTTKNTATTSIRGNGVERVPSRATWPPAWLADNEERMEKAGNQELPGGPTQAIVANRPGCDVTSEPFISTIDWAIPAETVAPCSQCGSLELWWDFFDQVHCMRCHPPRWDGAALAAKARASRLAADQQNPPPSLSVRLSQKRLGTQHGGI